MRASANTSALGTTPTQVPGKRLVDVLGRSTHAPFWRQGVAIFGGQVRCGHLQHLCEPLSTLRSLGPLYELYTVRARNTTMPGLKDFKICRSLGKGSFGSVNKVRIDE